MRILAEPGIEPATSCSQVRNATDWAMGLGFDPLKHSTYLGRQTLMILVSGAKQVYCQHFYLLSYQANYDTCT